MDLLRGVVSRRWLLTTLLVIVAAGVMARLGIWQLDRLEKRRAFNARVLAQIDQPPLELKGEALKDDLYNMEYRQILLRGEYNHSQEVALRSQYWQNQWGVHLVTPLHIEGSDLTVLVDRGWIPAEDFESGDWSRFAEPGTVIVRGVIRRPQVKADYGSRSDPTPAPGQAPLRAWNFVNISAISQQATTPLLPVYIQQSPDPAWSGLPYRSQPDLELSEGPHMGYAIQWFGFAALLVFGYPFFIRRQEIRKGIQATRQSGAHGTRQSGTLDQNV
jgi:surfeit locus 1 family protein